MRHPSIRGVGVRFALALTLETRVPGKVEGAHPALCKTADDLITTDVGGLTRHVRSPGSP